MEQNEQGELQDEVAGETVGDLRPGRAWEAGVRA